MSRDDSKISPRAAELLDSGEQIEAIKLIREETGLGLEEAKAAADAYLAAPSPEHGAAEDEAFANPDRNAIARISPRALEAIERGDTIEAIKVVREENRLGLKQAKEAVEAFIASNPGNRERQAAQRRDGGLGAGFWGFLAFMVAIALYIAWRAATNE